MEIQIFLCMQHKERHVYCLSVQYLTLHNNNTRFPYIIDISVRYIKVMYHSVVHFVTGRVHTYVDDCSLCMQSM